MVGNTFFKQTRMRRPKAFSFIIIFLLLVSARCDDEKQHPEFVHMIFMIPIEVLPASTVIKTTDTLWVTANFPDTLKEYYSGRYYKLPNFDFKSDLCMAKLVDKHQYYSWQQPVAAASYTSRIGTFNKFGSLCGDMKFLYTGNGYRFKLGIVIAQPGVYSLGLLMPLNLNSMPEDNVDLEPIIDLGETQDGRKRIPVYEAFFFTINNGDTHFELFRQHCRAGSVENPDDFKNVHAEQKGTFTFHVKE